jgi:hypothetical protein
MEDEMAGLKRIGVFPVDTDGVSGVLEVYIDTLINKIMFRLVFNRQEDTKHVMIFYEAAGHKESCYCNRREMRNSVRWNEKLYDTAFINLDESQIKITKVEGQVILRPECPIDNKNSARGIKCQEKRKEKGEGY